MRFAVVIVLGLLVACSPAGGKVDVRRVIGSASPAPLVVGSAPPAPDAVGSALPRVVDVPYRVEVRVPDRDGFAELLGSVMADPRGWSQAGFRVYQDPGAEYLVVLVEGAEAQELCLPYNVGSEFSCQNGPVVVVNARRWRTGVSHWPLTLHDYRVMLLNHEMGHLLGQRHRSCPGAGAVAPVMQQQSGSLDGCRANLWPLAEEIARAARHDQKLAPAYGE